MKKYVLYFLASVAVFGIILAVTSSRLPFYSGNANRDMVQVTATVLPERIIIVDSNSTIQEIYSNSTQTVQPVVFLDSMNGSQLNYSNGIASQYEKLEPTLNFSKTGLVYARDNHPILTFFKGIWAAISSWF